MASWFEEIAMWDFCQKQPKSVSGNTQDTPITNLLYSEALRGGSG